MVIAATSAGIHSKQNHKHGKTIAVDIATAGAKGEHSMPIDYERMKRVYPKQKAALTRALNQKDEAKRKAAVIVACTAVVLEWNVIGAWPDNWSRWQRALGDVRDYRRLEEL
jgi:hypothetical protein